jgi:hypothetical protein
MSEPTLRGSAATSDDPSTRLNGDIGDHEVIEPQGYIICSYLVWFDHFYTQALYFMHPSAFIVASVDVQLWCSI